MKRALVIVSLVSVAAHAAAPTLASSQQLIEKGKKVYEVNCTVCHGPSGHGDGPAGMALNPKPRNFEADAFKAGDSPEQVFGTVTGGLKGTNMSGFSSLSEEERWGVVYFILNLRKK